MPGAAPSAGKIVGNKTDKIPSLHGGEDKQ